MCVFSSHVHVLVTFFLLVRKPSLVFEVIARQNAQKCEDRLNSDF